MHLSPTSKSGYLSFKIRGHIAAVLIAVTVDDPVYILLCFPAGISYYINKVWQIASHTVTADVYRVDRLVLDDSCSPL